ncbi:AsmA family protein [Heliomarina baculiformis]|uniref:AsmA family protein n=1 Tax=Heliomarina baculiformis TaxID=2872036 RepID=UPI001EE2A15A|nr:AsmA family protein [Heliomarina baculiformis]
MRWIFRLIGAVLLALVTLGAGLFLLPQERIAEIAAEQIRNQTGREVTIGGGVRLSLWPTLGVKTGPVTVANADWADAEPMLRAEALSVGLSARDLLRGRIRVSEVVAEQPDLRLQQSADGVGNWEFTETEAVADGGETSGEAPGGSSPVMLERLKLSDARLLYRREGGGEFALSDVDLTLDWPEPSGVAHIGLAMSPAGERIKVAAQVANFQDFLASDVAPLTLEVATSGGTASFVGRARLNGEASGRVTMDADDIVKMQRALRLGQSFWPERMGRGVELVTEATYTLDQRLSLRDLSVLLDRNRVNGAADLYLADAVKLTARLNADALDLTPVSAKGGGGGAGSGSTRLGWSSTLIDASGLGLVNASVTLDAKSVRVAGTQLGAVQALFTLVDSRAVLDLVRVDAFDGEITGQLVANNRTGLSVGGALQAKGIEMQRLLSDMADINRFSGKADMKLTFLGVGQSADMIMRSLSGSGRIGMTAGEIAGIDLEALMDSGEQNGGTTVFETLKASFGITGGVLSNDDLAVELKNFRADGAGVIGLGERDIDYVITPVALRARGGEGLAIPVRISGSWARPRVQPDLEAVLKSNADVKLDALEERAKEKIRAKLSGAPGDTRDVEELLKDKIEEEAKKGFLKLLGGD